MAVLAHAVVVVPPQARLRPLRNAPESLANWSEFDLLESAEAWSVWDKIAQVRINQPRTTEGSQSSGIEYSTTWKLITGVGSYSSSSSSGAPRWRGAVIGVVQHGSLAGEPNRGATAWMAAAS